MRETAATSVGCSSMESEDSLRLSLLQYELLLVGACIVGCLICAAPLFLSGRSIVRIIDSIEQYVNGLILVGRVLRKMVHGLTSGNGLVLDNFLFSLGFGVDTSGICFLSDPLTWISALVPVRFVPFLYQVLQFVRATLVAVTFSLYCLYLKRDRRATFVAALCYSLSGFSIYYGFFNPPFFFDPCYMFPLVALGIERFFREGKPSAFIIATAISFVLSAYFGYMITLGVILYCLVRYFFCSRERSFADFFLLMVSFLAMGLLALALSSVVSLPYIESVAALDRIGVEVAVPPVYSAEYYLRLLSASLVGNSISYIGALPLVCVVAFLMFRGRYVRDERRAWIVAFSIAAFCMLIPFCGHVFNGFSYVSDRWLFLYDFVIANIVCIALPILWELSKEDKVRLFLFLIPFAIWAVFPLLLQDNYLPVIIGGSTLLLGSFPFVALPKKWASHRYLVAVVVVLFCAGIASITAFAPKPYGANRTTKYLSFEALPGFFTTDNPYQVVESLDEEELEKWRYSLASNPAIQYYNESLNLERNGLNCYVSFYSQPVCDYRSELGIADNSSSNFYCGSDCRLALDAFAGARYLVVGKDEDWRVPATYEDTGLSTNGMRLFKTDHALPLGFLCDRAISREDYEPLSMVEKQEALLQGCVLADDMLGKSGLERMSPKEMNLCSTEIPFVTTSEKGITFEDNKIVVRNPKAALTFQFEGSGDAETYVCFTNLQRVHTPKRIAWHSDLRRLVKSMDPFDEPEFNVRVTTSLGTSKMRAFTKYRDLYSGKVDWTLNCGYSKEGLHEMRVTFDRAGTYTFDDMTVVCQPIAPVVSELDALREHPLKDIKRGNGKVTAHATTNKDHTVALFTQAYSSGWSAKVDGKPADVLKGDTGFIAVPIEGVGEHDIELTYVTPGFLPGLVVSLLTAACCGAWLAVRHVRGQRERDGELPHGRS